MEVLEGDIWTIKAVWKCVICDQKTKKNVQFDDKNDFLDHLKRHCHICNISFTNYKTSHIHFQNEHLQKAKFGYVKLHINLLVFLAF